MPVVQVGEPLEQIGAYVTDGKRLLCVHDVGLVRDGIARPEVQVWLEDAITGRIEQMSLRYAKRFEFVREAEPDDNSDNND